MSQPLLVMTTVPDAEVAHRLADAAVSQQLAACVNYQASSTSVYKWQGKVEQAQELSMHFKTTQARYAELEALIQGLHPYEVPEIIALPIVTGAAAYLEWMQEETRKPIQT